MLSLLIFALDAGIQWGTYIKLALAIATVVVLQIVVVLLIVELVGKRNRDKKTSGDTFLVLKDQPAVAEMATVTESVSQKPSEQQIVEQSVEKQSDDCATSALAVVDKESVEPIVEDVVQEPVEQIVENPDEVPVEEIVEEVVQDVVQEPVEQIVENPDEVPVEEIVEENADLSSVAITADTVIVDEGGDVGTVIVDNKQIRVRYLRSFTAKLSQSDDDLKERYNAIKNELIAYGLKARTSWHGETFRKGRVAYAKLSIIGKTLSVYLALDPAEFEGTKYNVTNVGETKRYEEVPLRLKLKSRRSVKWGVELIAILAEKFGLERKEKDFVDTAPEFRTTAEWVSAGEIKLIGVSAKTLAERTAEEIARRVNATDEGSENSEVDVTADNASEVVSENVIETTDVSEPTVEDAVTDDEEVVSDVVSEEISALNDVQLDENSILTDEGGDVGTVIVDNKQIRVRYLRSFTAKLSQSDDDLKERYNAIKNELIAYGLKARTSWHGETFRKGRVAYAKLSIIGKTLSVYLALDPAEFEGTKYNVTNVGETKKYAAVPLRLKVKSMRAVKWSKELIAVLAEKNGFVAKKVAETDFKLPYQSTRELVLDKQIKLVGLTLDDLPNAETK